MLYLSYVISASCYKGSCGKFVKLGQREGFNRVNTAYRISAENLAETLEEMNRAIIWHIIPISATASIIPPFLEYMVYHQMVYCIYDIDI
jgi:hypothetical protein